MLNASRAAQGIGAAIMFAVSLAVLSNAFPKPGERAKALAVYGATIGGAFAVGPVVGGALTSGLDWQWIFIVNIPIGLAGIAVTRAFVEESRDPQPRGIDWLGQVLLTGSLFLLVLALLRGNEDGWTSPVILTELGGAAALMAAFVAAQRIVRDPMIPAGLFRNRTFTGAQIAVFGISASFFAVFLYTTLYLQQILGLSPIEAGLVYLPGTMIMFFVSGATASLGEKISPKLMIVAGLVLVGAGQALLTVAAVSSSVDGVPSGQHHRDDRHRAVQSGPHRRGPRLGAGRAERPRRRRQRHVPPGRHRRRRRRAGGPRARRRGVRERLARVLRLRHERRAVGRRGRLLRRRDRVRAAHQGPPRRRSGAARAGARSRLAPLASWPTPAPRARASVLQGAALRRAQVPAQPAAVRSSGSGQP
jgi:hypothetical protein